MCQRTVYQHLLFSTAFPDSLESSTEAIDCSHQRWHAFSISCLKILPHLPNSSPQHSPCRPQPLSRHQCANACQTTSLLDCLIGSRRVAHYKHSYQTPPGKQGAACEDVGLRLLVEVCENTMIVPPTWREIAIRSEQKPSAGHDRKSSDKA